MLSIKFADGELIQIEKGWNDLPNKPILRVKITIDNHVMMMENYESYNHLQEYCTNLLSGNKTLRNRYLLGRKGDKIKGIKYNYISNTFEEFECEFGKEYNGRPSTGWKEGIKSEENDFLYF
jgi:hypothetical protein